jgi:hypothetical protein
LKRWACMMSAAYSCPRVRSIPVMSFASSRRLVSAALRQRGQLSA